MCQERDTSEELGAWKEEPGKSLQVTFTCSCVPVLWLTAICENQKMTMLWGAWNLERGDHASTIWPCQPRASKTSLRSNVGNQRAETQSGNLRKYAPYAFSSTSVKGPGILIVSTVSFSALFLGIESSISQSHDSRLSFLSAGLTGSSPAALHLALPSSQSAACQQHARR